MSDESVLSDESNLGEAHVSCMGRMGQSVTKQFLKVISDQKTPWKLTKESEGVKVFKYEHKSMKKGAASKMVTFKSESLVDCSPAQAIDFLNPAKLYRLQWDLLMGKFEMTRDVGEEVLLVFHSRREEPELMTIGETDDLYYIADAGVPILDDTTTGDSKMLITEFPSGYVVYKEPVAKGHTKVVEVHSVQLPHICYKPGCECEAAVKTNLVMDDKLANQVKPTVLIQRFVQLKWGLKNLTYSG